MTDWRIYYGDGSTFDSNDGCPQDAPGGGVVAVVQVDDSCGWICRSGDFYLHDASYGG